MLGASLGIVHAKAGDDERNRLGKFLTKTLQTTNIWLDEIMADYGPDRRVAWHILGAV